MKKVIFGFMLLSIFILTNQSNAANNIELNNLKGNISKKILSDSKEHEYIIVKPLSKIKFYGRSTLHKFHGLTNNIHGFIRVSPSHIENAKGEIYFKAKSLHTEKHKLNKNMWENLEADKYPVVKYNLTSVKVLSSNLEEGRARVLITGALDLHNVIRYITFPLDVRYVDGFFRFVGEYRLDMKDYKIKPHSFLFFIRVKKDVDIKIDLYAKLKEGK